MLALITGAHAAAQTAYAPIAIDAQQGRVPKADGYLVRQGKRCRNKTNESCDALIIDENADFHILVDPTPEQKGSEGLTIEEFAQLMQELGAVQAYNLDGGSSSAMILGGEKINARTAKKVRPICDMLVFSTLEQ